MVPATNVQTMKLSCEPELNMIAQQFKRLDGDSQMQMLKKLREIACPDSIPLIEPAKKKIGTCGHASKKVDTSTCRDPSAFELVLSGQDSYSPRIEPISTGIPMMQMQKRLKQKVKSICLFFNIECWADPCRTETCHAMSECVEPARGVLC